MPKRRRGELHGGRRRHLYLIFDDWSRGYSIRNVNLLSSASSGGGAELEQRLPRAFWRFEAERGMPKHFTSAFDTRIVSTPSRSSTSARGASCRSLRRPAAYFPIAGDRLFLLDTRTFELCRLPQDDASDASTPSPCYSPSYYGVKDSEYNREYGRWWHHLPPPMLPDVVSSYAVHSDGRTLLVSTKNEDKDAATFTFDTESSTWKHHGDWTLPFTGRGHFDRDLDAIIGLSKDPDTLGHLCSCDVTNADTGKELSPDYPAWNLFCSEEKEKVISEDETGNSSRLCPAPAWKLSKEKVLSEDPAERHVGATLLYMGRRSKFCIVECLAIDDDDAWARHQAPLMEEPPGEVVLQCSRYVYRVVTFSLRYDEIGDLRVKRRRVRWYDVPRKTTAEFVRGDDPVAFWL